MRSILSQIAKATVLTTVAFAACPEAAQAIPAIPSPIKVKQPDGSVIEIRLHGDEHHSAITTADCTRVLRRDPDGRYIAGETFDLAGFRRHNAPPARRLSGENGFPTHGKQKALAILVEYPETDKHPSGRKFTIDNPRQHFDDMLNKEGFDTDGATGSVRDYFLDASSGIFDLTFDVFGPITLSEDLSFYAQKINGEDLNAWRMAEEACRALDSQIDFNEYDRDSDGIIDNVYVFYAGEGGATSANPDDCIWQHAANVESITGQQFLFDGCRLNHYACSNEYRIITDDAGRETLLTEGIGTVCHEFSHVLGLPDLYDTSGMGIYTPGEWALMDLGCHLNNSRTPPNFTALERMMLGWIDPVTIEQKPQTLSLRDITSNEAYRIDTPNENEYFLLENRQLKGWDIYLPGHGLLVWHIKYSKAYWDANQVNTRSNDLGVDIVRADGIKGNDTRDGDTFPGASKVTALNDDGFPNMLTNDSKRTETPLSRITEAGGLITFDVCKTVSQLGKVTGLKADGITPTGFTASWDAVSNASGYVLNVFTRADNGTTAPAGRYHDLNISSTSAQISGLNAETDYFVTVRAVSGAVSGAMSDECKVTTPAMTFEYTAPEGLKATDTTDSSVTVSWNSLADATDYSVTVSTRQPGEPESTEVDFTDGVEILPDGWVTNSNFTISMNGYYGNASPSLSLPDDYGRLQSPLLPTTLTGLRFWYRERSGSGSGYIVVSVLDGAQWVDVDRIDLPERMSEGISYNLDSDKIPENAAAARIVYRRGSKGSLAIDDVVAEYAGPTVATPLAGWDDKALGSSATETRIDGLESGHDYYVAVRGIDASGTRSMPSAEIKVTAGNSRLGHVSNDNTLSIRVDADGNVTVDATDRTSIGIFDMQGRRITGLRLPCRGIYLLKANGITTKLIY
ncbi:MAG: M6 family metalloprotease domain-containing protein [Muribaculaceae bacterium]|nr:M6 family metalloprotease domain-containing protein [Muribaculaceae bacterium]